MPVSPAGANAEFSPFSAPPPIPQHRQSGQRGWASEPPHKAAEQAVVGHGIVFEAVD